MRSCKKYKSKVVIGGYCLQVLWFLGFVPVSVGMILSWVGEEDEKTYTNTNNCSVLYHIYIASLINCIQPDDGHSSIG